MDQVSQVREKTDLVSLIGEHVVLKKAGRNFKANCPFHSEKTPSFVVSPERQIWHCFGGCNKGGDCFSFLMEYEKIDFSEALRMLARKANIVLVNDFSKETYSKRDFLYKLNQQACSFYQYILVSHKIGERAMDYLIKERKLNKNLIKTFSLGFSPSSEDSLSKYLIAKKHYKPQDLIDAGLSFYKMGKVVDFFKNRIMFPLFDHRDNIVGFSGRSLDAKAMSKYINTRETEIYHKGSVFFGLNLAKDDIRAKNEAIIVEGEFDVISSFAEGIKNIVAIKGTALTDNQALLISRFAKKILLCLDNDSAGLEAIKRSIVVLEDRSLISSVVVIPQKKDPDEAVKTNPSVFKKSIKDNINAYDFLLSDFIYRVDVSSSEGKRMVADSFLPFMAKIQNEIVKEHYLRKLSKAIDTSYDSLTKELDRSIFKKEGVGKTLQYSTLKKPRREMLEEYLIALLLQSQDPKSSFDRLHESLFEYEFKVPGCRKIIETMNKYFKNIAVFNVKNFATGVPEEALQVFNTCWILPIPTFDTKVKLLLEIDIVVKQLNSIFIKDKISILTKLMSDKQKVQGREESDGLKKELLRLTSLLPKT